MKKIEEKRTIKVNVVEFDNGKQIDSDVIEKFINYVSCDFLDTINASEHYTDEYFYFETDEEKKLEDILIEYDVIKKAPEQKYHNDLVGKVSYAKDYRYRLGSNYRRFESDFYNTIYDEN